MADDPFLSALDRSAQERRDTRAQANVAGAYQVPSAAAVTAFKAAPRTQIDPSLGMLDAENQRTMASQATAEEILGRSSAVRKLAERSPAHVAATREDWPALAKVGDYAGLAGLGFGRSMVEMGKATAQMATGSKEVGILGTLLYDQALKRFGDRGPPKEGDRRLAYMAGAFAPGLASPGTGITKMLSFLGPLIGEEAGFYAGSAVAGEKGGEVGSFVGALAGGVGPFLKVFPKPRPRGVVDEGTFDTTQRRLPGPREPVVDAEFEPIKPPGVNPRNAETYRTVAELDSGVIADMETAVAETTTQKQLPALTAEFLEGTEVAGKSVWVNPEVLLQLYSEGQSPFPQFNVAIGEALNAGRDVELPLSAYLAEVSGKPYAEVLRANTRFREDGVSVEEGKNLPTQEDLTAQIVDLGKQIETKLGDTDGMEWADIDAMVAAAPETSNLVKQYSLLMERRSFESAAPLLEEAVARLPEGWTAKRVTNVGGPSEGYGRHFTTKVFVFNPAGDVAGAAQFRGDLERLFENVINKGDTRSVHQRALDAARAEGAPANDTDLDDIAAKLAEGEPTPPPKGTVVKLKDVPEDVAADFPRELLARAESAVDEVFAEQMLTSLFTDAKALKMGKAQFERYDAMLSEARAEAVERVLQRTYTQLRKERTPEWKEQIAQASAAVERELSEVPAIRAWSELTRGKGALGEVLEGGVKFAKEGGLSGYARDLGLPRSMFSADGLDPDDAAPLLGYANGTALINDLAALREEMGERDLRAYTREVARTVAEERARSALGYDASPEGLREAAREEAVLPAVEAFLEASLRDLADEVGLPFDKAAVEAEAQRQFDTLRVKDAVKVKTFERGMWSTGNRTQVALEKGEWPKAFVSRQQQLINFYQLKMSHFLAKKVAVGERTFRRLARKPTIRGLSQPFLDQLHTYLPQWGYRVTREPTELAEALGGRTLPEFVADIIATDAAFPSVPDVAPSAISELSVDDYWKVRGFVFAMNRYGRELQTLRSGEKRVARDEVIAAALASVPPGKPPKTPAVLEADNRRSVGKNIVSFLKSYDAFHRKAADFIEWMDGGNPLGVWSQNVTAPMMEGADVESALHRAAYEPVVRAWTKVPAKVKKAYNSKITTPFTSQGQPVQFYRRNILRMAMLAGTESSLIKAAEGFGVEVMEYLDVINAHITPEEVAMVQAVWDGFEELSVPVSDALRALTGQGLRRETKVPVELGGVSTRGGYVPLVYDRRAELNPEVARWEAERDVQISPDGLDQLFGEVLPNKGFSEERSNYVGVVDVGLEGLSGLFNSHIKYAAFARPVSDVRKFVNNPLIAAAIERKWGREYVNIIPDWLNGVVAPFNVGEKTIEPIQRGFEVLGRNMTAGALGFSYGTLIAQAGGFVNGVAVLSNGNIVRGVVSMLGGYRDVLSAAASTTLNADGLRNPAFSDMFTASEFMRHRYGAMEQNLTEALMEADDLVVRGKVREANRYLTRLAFQAIGWVEFATVSAPTWYAARKQALGEGLSEAEAVKYANRMVVKSQGSGRRVDLAAVQRARGVVKLMYAFQSYFNQQYQLAVDVGRNFGGGGQGPPREPPALDAEPDGEGVWSVPPIQRYKHAQGAILLAMVFIAGGVLGAYLAPGKDEPQDVVLNLFRPLFGLNTLTRAIDRAIDVKDGKVSAKTFNAKFGDDLFTRAGEIVTMNILNAVAWSNGKKARRPFQTAMGLPQMAGIVGSAQVGRAGEYLMQVEAGEQRPRSGQEWVDIYTGLAGGPQPEQAVKRRGGRSVR